MFGLILQGLICASLQFVIEYINDLSWVFKWLVKFMFALAFKKTLCCITCKRSYRCSNDVMVMFVEPLIEYSSRCGLVRFLV